MSDGFEVDNGFNPLLDDGVALSDTDGDGLSNFVESEHGTSALNVDTDGDNSPDGDEDIAGTNPLDAGSFFYVSDITPLLAGGCEITFDTVLERTYTVYCSTDLGGTWDIVGAPIVGDDNPAIVVDSYDGGSCFYKVEVTK